MFGGKSVLTSESERKLPPRPGSVGEEHTMSRTVHGLQSVGFLLNLKTEHVLGVVLRRGEYISILYISTLVSYNL